MTHVIPYVECHMMPYQNSVQPASSFVASWIRGFVDPTRIHSGLPSVTDDEGDDDDGDNGDDDDDEDDGDDDDDDDETARRGANVLGAQQRSDVWVYGWVAGYRVSGTHCSPLAVKTDAPWDVIWDIMRAWVVDHPVKPQVASHTTTTASSTPHNLLLCMLLCAHPCAR